MGINEQIYEVFRSNIISYGLENAAKILEVDFNFLSNLLNNDSINYNDLRLRYAIKLREHSNKKNIIKKNKTIF